LPELKGRKRFPGAILMNAMEIGAAQGLT